MSTNSDTTTARAHITQIANKASAMNIGTSNAEKRNVAGSDEERTLAH
jgi:hypothetical protein